MIGRRRGAANARHRAFPIAAGRGRARSGVVIAVLGQVLRRRYPRDGPGQVQEIPPYALPRGLPMLRETWERTRDILTIVTPLLA